MPGSCAVHACTAFPSVVPVSRRISICVTFLCVQGIYRIPGQKSVYMQIVTDAIDKLKTASFADEDVHSCASALKQYLRQLSNPLLTAKLSPMFIKALSTTAHCVMLLHADDTPAADLQTLQMKTRSSQSL